MKNEMIRGTERKQQVKNSSIYINYKWFGAKFMHYDIWLYAVIFFSLKMLTLPDINHNVPLCWLLVIGRKGCLPVPLTQLGFDGRPPQGLPFWFPLTQFCSSIVFCFRGGGWGRGNSMHKISISTGSNFCHRDHFMHLFFHVVFAVICPSSS